MIPAATLRPAPERLRHKTVAAAVADSLRERILNGELAPGMQLRQDALAEEFGISRIPVREALLQLEATNLVKIVPHRGAVVSGLTLGELEDIFQLRAQMEPQLLILSAPRLTPDDFNALRALSEEYCGALESNQILRWGDLNRRFHLDLLRHAGRPRSLTILSGLLQDCDRPTRLQLATSGDMAAAVREHTEILDLCEARTFDRAAERLLSHITQVGTALIGLQRRAVAAP
jgi:DNA-binding GntR family transcriptional regulator